MTPVLLSRLLFPVLLVAFLLALEAGRVLRRRHLARRPPGADDGASFQVVQGAVFGLMGLLLAFAFSGASSRFDLRRQLTLDEANALGTAWLRLDLLPDSARGPLQGQLRAYAEARIAMHRAIPEAAAKARAQGTADSLQHLIWPAAVRASQAAPTPLAGLLLLPALNEAFDVGNARVTYTMVHLPLPILWVLLGMAMACAVLAGYSLASAGPRDWLNSLTFALVATVVLGVILDFEFPRVGRINLARYDEVMVRAVEGMR